jgi:hypothetical protein
MDRSYNPTEGKFRRTCTNPNCNQPFWGRQDQLYCAQRCKNQVNNKKWRLQNPKLTEKEKEIRRNHRILLELAKTHGYDKWHSLTILKASGFNGTLMHSYSETLIGDKQPCNVITLFDTKLYTTTTHFQIKTKL